MTLIWSRQAVVDLTKLRRYIEEQDPGAASEVATRILEAVGQLEQFPGIGPPGRIAGTRELVIKRTPYLVVYRIGREAVHLLRIFHTRQKWPETL